METEFESLIEAICFAFREKQTSCLGLDAICEVLSSPNLFIKHKVKGLIATSSIPRRRISSALSGCDRFERAGSAHSTRWALRIHGEQTVSDVEVCTSVENTLTDIGPTDSENLASSLGIDQEFLLKVLQRHSDEFTLIENGWWFTDTPLPLREDYPTMAHAIFIALKSFPEGATVEQLHRVLCLSTVVGKKRITRRSVSRELSRRPKMFHHVSRAQYALCEQGQSFPQIMEYTDLSEQSSSLPGSHETYGGFDVSSAPGYFAEEPMEPDQGEFDVSSFFDEDADFGIF